MTDDIRDDLRRRFITPPLATQLPSGNWIARRFGLAGTGDTPLRALTDLVTKELLQHGIRARVRSPRIVSDAVADRGDADDGFLTIRK